MNPVVASDKLKRAEVWAEDDESVHWAGAFAVYGGYGTTASSTIVYGIEPGHRLGWHTDATEETHYIILVPGNCTRKMAVATRVGPGSIFAIPTPVKHTSSMSARETLRAVAFFAAAFYSKLRQPDDAAKEPHPRHSESRKLAAFQARRRKQNPGRTCYPFGFGGSPGFAASPGFGGAP